MVVLVTDGQVGNEDQILRELAGDVDGVRIHTVGIDRAVNAGFLGRLAGMGGGRCELVESEDRLDEAMDDIHRRIGAPLAYDLRLRTEGLDAIEGTATPARLPDLFPGVPLVISGRYQSSNAGCVVVQGITRDGKDWSASVTGQLSGACAITAQWARAHVRDLEDQFLSESVWDADDLERTIVDTSLRFGVLCRFTAYVAVDSRVVAEGGDVHRVVQPVELPSGWYDDVDESPIGALRAALSMEEMSPIACAPMPSLDGLILGSRPAPLGAGMALPAPAGDDRELTAARQQVRDEVRRMRKAGALSDYEKREWLADLATRLSALVCHLKDLDVASSAFAALKKLVKAIRAGGSVDQLWDRAVKVLDEFAAGAAKPKRRPFWKG